MITLLATDPTDIGGLLRDLLSFAQAGKWMALVGVVLMLLVTGLRWGLGKKIPWFKTPRGGVTLAFGTALLATIGGALAAGQPFSFEIVMAAISVAFTAGGIHTRVTSAIEAHAAKKTKTPS